MKARKQEDSPTRKRITIVCTSKVYLDSGEIGIVFLEDNEDGSLGSERVYGQKNFKHVRVASVYEAEAAPESARSIYPGTIRWLRLWDQAQGAVWQAMADAFNTRDLAMKQERKSKARSLPVELLEPIRDQYWSVIAVPALLYLKLQGLKPISFML